LERHQYVDKIENLFVNEDMKSKNLSYIVYKQRVSSLLVSLPIDIINRYNKLKLEKDKKSRLEARRASVQPDPQENEPPQENLIPRYIFQSDSMNLFNFIALKTIRMANNFRKCWIWVKENKKTIADFIKIIARHRILEGYELVHTCNDDLLFIKTIKLEKHGLDGKITCTPALVQYLIKQDKSDPTYVKTEVYMEKESGRYSIKNKKIKSTDAINPKCNDCDCHGIYSREDSGVDESLKKLSLDVEVCCEKC
jgi:hypothetical protein